MEGIGSLWSVFWGQTFSRSLIIITQPSYNGTVCLPQPQAAEFSSYALGPRALAFCSHQPCSPGTGRWLSVSTLVGPWAVSSWVQGRVLVPGFCILFSCFSFYLATGGILSDMLRMKEVGREPVASLCQGMVLCYMGDSSVISGMQTWTWVTHYLCHLN
jgi:hypothetical protein